MAHDDVDPVEEHDPLGQNEEENREAAMADERVTGTEEVTPAEESALNTDNEVALGATDATAVGPTENEQTAEDEEAFNEAVDNFERKHKNRESTSEKAKRAETEHKTRQSTSEKAKLAEEERKKQLDPLRLRGKKYRAVFAQVDPAKEYSPEEAIALVKQVSLTKFDGAVELHAKVKSEGVRGVVVLPAGSGKTKKVAVATDEVIEAIAAGKLDFEVLLATPAQMPKLAKFAKLLGPKGLMPSPKSGTVTDDVEKVAKEIGGGRVEYRADKSGVVHMSIGRISFTDEQLLQNYRAMEQVLLGSKILSISLAPTMGPGVKVVLTK